MHKSKIVNNSKKILPTFLLLLGTTALSGLPNVAMADEEMIIIADTNGDGTIDGTAGEWATGNSYTDAISPDGSFIAGRADDGTADRAFRWDATRSTSQIQMVTVLSMEAPANGLQATVILTLFRPTALS